MDELLELSKHLDAHDMSFEPLTGDGLLKVEPSLVQVADQICGGVYFPGDQAGNAYQFTCEMEKQAKKLGVKFRYGISVTSLCREGAQISKLKTSEGELKSDLFVLAAGSYSSLLAKTAGLNVPVRPGKGIFINGTFKWWNHGPRMSLIDDGFHAAITPLGDVLRVAGTAEFAGYDRSLTKSRLDNLYNLLDEIYPDFKPYIERDKVTEWAGLRPLSTDGSPFIGKTPIDNLYLNTGHGPLGWTMAAGSAKMLSDIVSGVKPALEESAYNIKRA